MAEHINIAAQYNGEMKRFQCLPTIEALQQTLLTVFPDSYPVTIQFVNNQNNLALLSSQSDLTQAASFATEVQLVLNKAAPLFKTEPLQTEPILKSEKLEDDAAVASTLDNRLLKLQNRYAFVQNALSRPELPEHKRTTLTERKKKLETLIENYQTYSGNHQTFPGRRTRGRKNPRVRENKLQERQEVDAALSKNNLSVKEIEKLNKRRARTEANKNNRFESFKILELQAALDQPDLPPRRQEQLKKKKNDSKRKWLEKIPD
jgi:hypothetical protein